MPKLGINNLLQDSHIDYTSEVDIKFYKELRNVKTLEAIKDLFTIYELLVWDGLDTIKDWTNKDFIDFKHAQEIESTSTWMGKENQKRFASVLLPDPMFRISIKAATMKVCFGLVYQRLIQMGIATVVNDRLIVSRPNNAE